ncbi:FHA domain-containing protein [Pengzhenrongella sicca]|uniref:FHA domain-containing protein n=1 Tax=Pengzhenrongella sicca TaxID=2819238 RepID=A0A8A4ZDL0_9MICO|nr:FHA domain-containing protein [Pengzhenrongella sicca]QTE28983.1 FHA domain-containing protein [Pengzhenrongella sicca]
MLIVRVNGTERRLRPGDSLSIGRAPTCDVRIADPLVSRVHVRIAQEAGAWVVRDVASANGVHVNGHRLDAFSVDQSMVIVLGPPETGVRVELVLETVADLDRSFLPPIASFPAPIGSGAVPISSIPGIGPVLSERPEGIGLRDRDDAAQIDGRRGVQRQPAA